MGEKCHLETWYEGKGSWFGKDTFMSYAKCTHLASGMVTEGRDKHSSMTAAIHAKNACTSMISVWLNQKRQQEEIQRLRDEAHRRDDQLRQAHDARRRAEEERQRAQAEAQRRV